MKKIIVTAFLTILCLNLASCNKEESPNSLTSETVAQEEKVETPTDEAKDFAQQISLCKKDWLHFVGNSTHEEEALVAIGIVGRECLKIERVWSYKKILSAYEASRNGENVDWIKLSQQVIQMESLWKTE